MKIKKELRDSIHKTSEFFFGAGDRGRTGTVSLPLDFELFAPHGTQTNSAPCGGRCRTPKSLANTTVFEADV